MTVQIGPKHERLTHLKVLPTPPPLADLDRALASFLLDGEARRLTAATFTFYRDQLEPFLRHLHELHHSTLSAITPNDIRAYLVALQDRELSDNSIHAAARAIKAFLNFCVREELLTVIAGFADLETAQRLLADNGGIAGLAQKSLTELTQIKGIGESKAAQVKAAFELGRRLLVVAPHERPVIKSPADAANLLMLEMAQFEQEHLVTLVLDTKNRVLKIHTLYIGSLNTAVVRVAELFKEAIRMNAAAVIVCHNHPSGDPTPSAEDVHVTRQIVEAGKLLSIDVLDHLVIGQGKWVSLKERGLGF